MGSREFEWGDRVTVYFVRFEDRGRWKIGYTAGPPDIRLRGALTFTPCKIWLEAELDGNERTETEIHRRFASLRVDLDGRNEIFETSTELEEFVAFIAEHGTAVGFDTARTSDPVRHRLNALRGRLSNATRQSAKERNRRLKRQWVADQKEWQAVLRGIEQDVTHTWSRIGRAYALPPFEALPRDHVYSSAEGAYWRTISGGGEDGCSERAGVRMGLRFLLRARDEASLALSWTALVVQEALWSHRRDGGPGHAKLEAIQDLAGTRLGSFPDFHHSCSQVLPAPVPVDMHREDETESICGITRIARFHFDHCIRNYRAVTPIRAERAARNGPSFIQRSP